MNMHRKRRLPWVLMTLGAILSLSALFMLLQTQNVLQYCVIAPQAGENGENIVVLENTARDLGRSTKDTVAWMTLHGVNSEVSLTANGNTVTANLMAIDEGWLEVYPRFIKTGRRISEAELEQGAPVMMLDDRLAFRLFGEPLPENATVKLNNTDYRVVGTVRHGDSLFGGRSVADTVEYDAYVPLRAAAVHGIALEELTLSARPRSGMGAASKLFIQGARQWMAGGQLIDLQKESMRRMILPRILLLIVGLYAMLGLFRRATDVVMGWFAGFRQALKGSYFRELIWRLVGIIALSLALYAALIAVTYLLLVFSAQPLYVFTEWIPENIVEWSSITNVFWNLTSDAAVLTRIGTRELRVIEFWGGVLRWGMVLLLLGAALLPKAWAPKGK